MLFWAPARRGEPPIVAQPWEPLQAFTDQLLEQSRWITWGVRPGDDGAAPRLHWRFTCANGWAIYRRVGYDPQRQIFVGELVEGAYEPYKGGAGG